MRDNQTGRSLTTYRNDPKEVFAEQAFIHFYCKVATTEPLQTLDKTKRRKENE